MAVETIRKLGHTGVILGVGYDRTAWFVYDRRTRHETWSKHCGPYSSREQAVDWIKDVGATPTAMEGA